MVFTRPSELDGAEGDSRRLAVSRILEMVLNQILVPVTPPRRPGPRHRALLPCNLRRSQLSY